MTEMNTSARMSPGSHTHNTLVKRTGIYLVRCLSAASIFYVKNEIYSSVNYYHAN